MADTGPPDFVGVGSPDADAGRWHQLLLAHPDVHEPPEGRQLDFFGRFCARPMRDEDVAAYHERFPRPAGGIVGEWTPRYMGEPWTPRLLQRCAPGARIVALVCDPVERYRRRAERARGDGDGEERILQLVDAVARGRYATQLRNLRAWFDAEQILVLQAERCERDPAGEYARTLRFLGVRDDFAPRRLRRLRRRARRGDDGDRAAPLWPDIEAALVDELRPEAEELAAMVPELDLSLWPGLGPR